MTWFTLEVIVPEDKDFDRNSMIFLPSDPGNWAQEIKDDGPSYGYYCCAISNNQEGTAEKSLLIQILPSVESPYKDAGNCFGFSMRKEEAKKLAEALLFAASQLED